MAPRQVTESDIEGHDQTIQLAMQIWIVKDGPVSYNDWQSVYFQLRRLNFRDVDLPQGGESQAEFQVRLKKFWQDTNSQQHGPNWAREIAHQNSPPRDLGDQPLELGERRPASPPGLGEVPVFPEARVGELPPGDLRRELFEGAEAGVQRRLIVPDILNNQRNRRMQERQERIVEVGEQDLGDQAEGNPVEPIQFGAGQGTEESSAALGPYPCPSYDLARDEAPVTFLLNEEAQRIWYENADTHTEASDEAEERFLRLAESLKDCGGADEQSLTFTISVEQMVRQYKDLYYSYVMQNRDQGKDSLPIADWAIQRLTTLDNSKFQTKAALQIHVLALGKLAKREIKDCLSHAEVIWNTSPEQFRPESPDQFRPGSPDQVHQEQSTR